MVSSGWLSVAAIIPAPTAPANPLTALLTPKFCWSFSPNTGPIPRYPAVKSPSRPHDVDRPRKSVGAPYSEMILRHAHTHVR
eukprot:2928858-Prymnesium_polylepis.1